jgi:hypothetical protein
MNNLKKAIASIKAKLNQIIKTQYKGTPISFKFKYIDGIPEGGNLPFEMELTVGREKFNIESDGWITTWNGTIEEDFYRFREEIRTPAAKEFFRGMGSRTASDFVWRLIKLYLRESGYSQKLIREWYNLEGPRIFEGELLDSVETFARENDMSVEEARRVMEEHGWLD